MRTRTRLQFPGFAAIPAQALCHSFLRRKVAIRSFVGNASSHEGPHKIVDVTEKTQRLEPLTWNNTPNPVGVRFIAIVFGGSAQFHQ